MAKTLREEKNMILIFTTKENKLWKHDIPWLLPLRILNDNHRAVLDIQLCAIEWKAEISQVLLN